MSAASQGDPAGKRGASSGAGACARTAESDRNSGVIVGDGGAMAIEAAATPVMARSLIERV
ncbi:MAG TPA: hypothetical protein VFG47_17135, partial [Geminicoccaceae bacterium]|nr:hypothetical protein [Geminicoccaceae bacterium]